MAQLYSRLAAPAISIPSFIQALTSIMPDNGAGTAKALDSAHALLMEELTLYGEELRRDERLRDKMGSALLQFVVHAQPLIGRGSSSSAGEEEDNTLCRECVLFLAGPSYSHQFDVHSGRVRAPWEADVVIELRHLDLSSFLNGRVGILSSYLAGSVRVRGDKRCALDLHETMLTLRPRGHARRTLARSNAKASADNAGGDGTQRRTLLTFDEEAAILRAVDWREMKADTSRLVQWREGSGWVCLSEEIAYAEARGLYGARCCRVRKKAGVARPAFEVLSSEELGAGLVAGVATSGAHYAEARIGARFAGSDEHATLAYNLGLGLSTGGGLADDGSLRVKALGCGFTFGRRIGVSIFDTELQLDLAITFFTTEPGHTCTMVRTAPRI